MNSFNLLFLLLLSLISSITSFPPTALSSHPFISNRITHTHSTLLNLRGGSVETPSTLSDLTTLLKMAKKEKKSVVIDFSASWCKPCTIIKPVYDLLSEEFDDVIFVKVDVDEDAETASKYEVKSMPTFVFIDSKGEVVDRMAGANASKLRQTVERLK